MATITIDWDMGMPYQVQQIVLSDTTNTAVFDDPQDSTAPLILRVEQGSGLTPKLLSWPSNVFWESGVAPTLSLVAGNVDVLEFAAINTGSDFEYYGRVYALGIL